MDRPRQNPAHTIKLAILEDNANMIVGLKAEFALPGFEVCVISDEEEEFISLVTSCQPDIAIIDLRIWRNDSAGWEVVDKLNEASPATKTVIYTQHASLSNFDKALRADVSAFFSKDHDAKPERSLVEIVRIVDSGGRYYDPELYRKYWEAANPVDPLTIEMLGAGKDTQESELSPRVIEVLKLFDQGYTEVDIAEMLSISIHTVKAHSQKAREKLGVHSTNDAVRVAKLRNLF